MLIPKQRAFLRKLAQNISPIFQVGKGGISDNMVSQIATALEAHELIKIHLLHTSSKDKFTVAEELSTRTSSDVVHVIGNKITLYKKSTDNPTIELPN